jgi:NAD(P)-dependent dehydrogenase (short-subunit alcohol dehydrogenase family)
VRHEDKVCLITGAGSGIGQAAAWLFAKEMFTTYWAVEMTFANLIKLYLQRLKLDGFIWHQHRAELL